MENKYFGPHKIIGVKKEDFKTPLGNEVVRVVFDGAGDRIMPKSALELLQTDEPTDLTNLSDRRIDAAVISAFKALMEYDISGLEHLNLITTLTNKLTNAFDRAAHILMEKALYGEYNDKSWIPGSSFSMNRNITEIDKILQNTQDEPADKPEN